MTLAILWDLKRQKLLSCDNLWKLRGAGGPSVGLPWDENYLLIMNRLLRVWKPPTLMITNRYRNFVNYLLKIIIVFLTQKFSKIIQQHPPGKIPEHNLDIGIQLVQWECYGQCMLCTLRMQCWGGGGRGTIAGPAAPDWSAVAAPPPGPASPPPHPSSRRGIAAPLAQAGAALMNVYVFPDQRNGQYYMKVR